MRQACSLAFKMITALCLAVVLLGVCLLPAGCGLSGGSQPPPSPSPEEQLAQHVQVFRDNLVILERKVHDYVNDERVKAGLPALDWEDALNRIARYHSEDMATRDYFNHVSPEGETFSDRYKKFGYNCSRQVGMAVYMGGENLLMNNVSDYYTYDETTGEILEYHFLSLEDLAANAVSGWMGSPEHRENVLFPHFQKEGIGIYVTDSGKVYITENFC